MAPVQWNKWAETVGVIAGMVWTATGWIGPLQSGSNENTALSIPYLIAGLIIGFVELRYGKLDLIAKAVDFIPFLIRGIVYIVIAVPSFTYTPLIFGGICLITCGIMYIIAGMKGETRDPPAPAK